MATFANIPDWSPGGAIAPNVLSVRFGEGYEQAAEAGLNPYLPTWDLRFSNRTQAEATAIAAWLKTNKARTTSFDWTSPDGTVGKFRADKWTPAIPDALNNWSISASFRQVTA